MIFLLIAIVKMPEFWQNFVTEAGATSMDMVSVVVSTSDVGQSFGRETDEGSIRLKIAGSSDDPGGIFLGGFLKISRIFL